MQITHATKAEKLPPLPLMERAAVTPAEFDRLFGRHAPYCYRLIYAGKIKAIETIGRILIPITEVKRLLESAATYSGTASKGRGRKRKSTEAALPAEGIQA